MEKENNTSIIKEALTDYNAIMEAADANAKKKLAEEFPEKFNNLLKEEITNNDKSDKESYKKIDENKKSTKVDESEQTNKESVMENNVKGAEYAKKAKVGDSKPFGKKEGDVYKDKAETAEPTTSGDTVIKINNKNRDKDFTGDIEQDTPNLGKEKKKSGDPYTQKENANNPNDKENANITKNPIKEEFDITELGADSVDSTLNNLGEEDEVITLDDIENELSEIEEPEQGQNTSQYQELVNLKNKVDEMMKNFSEGGENVAEEQSMDEHHLDTKEQKLEFIASLDDEMIDKLYRSAEEQMGMTETTDQEVSITDDEIDNVFNDELQGKGTKSQFKKDYEKEHGRGYRADYGVEPGQENMGDVDEVKVNTHSAQKHVSNTLTQDDILQGRKRDAQQMKEQKLKIDGLIKENKKLTKKVNENKKFNKSANALIENYKSAIGRYRDQLKEMAIFNTNLAHVNNLLVNEELALTQDDKVKIIKDFKNIDTISESQKSYKKLLSEMKSKKKKNISENIEDKISTSVQPSSKKKLDEAVEKTAYENNKHISDMKRLIEYVENRGNKKKL